MNIDAKSIVKRVLLALQDPNGIRWTASELVDHLNDGAKILVTNRPDARTVRTTFTTIEGSTQYLADNMVELLDIPHNATGKKRAITKVSTDIMDRTVRDWRSANKSAEFDHFMFDKASPREFHLYPPSQATGGSIVVKHSEFPADIAKPNTANEIGVEGALDLEDKWDAALYAFILARAYSKDAEYGGNAALAGSYANTFSALIGQQLQSARSVSPKTQKE